MGSGTTLCIELQSFGVIVCTKADDNPNERDGDESGEDKCNHNNDELHKEVQYAKLHDSKKASGTETQILVPRLAGVLKLRGGGGEWQEREGTRGHRGRRLILVTQQRRSSSVRFASVTRVQPQQAQ